MSTVLRVLLLVGLSSLLLVPLQSQTGGDGASIRLDLPNSDRTSDEDEEDLPEVIKFFENPYEGEAFMFCCDHSSSMNNTWQSRVKLQWLKEELIRAINQLSTAGEYSINFFDAGMLIFSETPVAADPAGRQRGIAWVMAAPPGRGTCLAPAGVRSIQILYRSTKQYRTLIILTDGMPSCNGSMTQAQCLRDITGANTQRSPVHTIFIPDDGTWEDPDFLRQLAMMNNGTFKMVGQ